MQTFSACYCLLTSMTSMNWKVQKGGLLFISFLGQYFNPGGKRYSWIHTAHRPTTHPKCPQILSTLPHPSTPEKTNIHWLDLWFLSGGDVDKYFEAYVWQIIIQGGFFHWYPPILVPKIKPAKQPITAFFSNRIYRNSSSDWLVGCFLFGTEVGEYQWKKSPCMLE